MPPTETDLGTIHARIEALGDAINRAREHLGRPHVPIQLLLNLIFVAMDERARAMRAAGAFLAQLRAEMDAECGSDAAVTDLLDEASRSRTSAFETEIAVREMLATRLLGVPTKAVA